MITPFEEGKKRPGVISYGLSSLGYDVRIGYKFRVFKSYPHTEIDPKNFNPALLEEVDLTPLTYCPDCPEGEAAKSSGFTCSGGLGPPACKTCSDTGTVRDDHQPPDHILIPPHSFALGESVEWFKIPRDILVVALGKSSYARCGLVVNVTPGEPDWSGIWTIEMSNTTPLPLRVYAGEGIMQTLFLRSDERDRATEMAMLDRLSGRDIQAHYLYEKALKEAGCETSYADKKGKYEGQTGLTLPKVD